MSDDTVNGLSIFATSNVKVSINDSLSTTTDNVDFGAANLSSVIGGTSATSCSIDAVATLNTAIQNLASLRATNGATQSNLGFQLELQSAAKINQESAVSRIMDVDVAEESTKLARWNTLVQAGTSMIAQANGSTQSALQLLR
jgi:flagellin